MKIKKGFTLRKIAGEYIIVAEGKENIDFNKIIVLNETAKFLWERFCDKDFVINDLVDALLEEYEVDRDRAKKDVELLLKQFNNSQLLEDFKE